MVKTLPGEETEVDISCQEFVELQVVCLQLKGVLEGLRYHPLVPSLIGFFDPWQLLRVINLLD